MSKLIRKIRLVLYWGLPPIILYLVFSRIDFGRLIDLAATANPGLILAGTVLIFLKILAGSLRWHFLARSYDSCLTLRASILEYWISLTLGVIALGSLGSDAYRIALSGRQTGRYLRGAFVIGIEKVAALLSFAVLIAGVYPFLTFESLPDSVSYAIDIAYFSLAVSIGLVLLAALTHRSNGLMNLANAFSRKITQLARKVETRVRRMPVRDEATERSSIELFFSAFKPRVALPTIFLSSTIPIIGAVSSQLFFQALGYDLPFLVNVFVAPLILLVFTLPISFGSLGIREGAFIVFYGAFGVPVETALLVSFCGLLSVLLGHAVGALLFFSHRRQQRIVEIPLDNSVQEK